VSRVRIFGIGSPSGDDQAGWLVVDALLETGILRDSGIVIEKLDRPGASLISRMEGAERIVVVDAMQSGGMPGGIRHFDRNDVSDYGQGLSSHGFGVLAALTLARELGSLPPRLDLYGIEIGSAMPGEEACAAVGTAARQLASSIASELNVRARG